MVLDLQNKEQNLLNKELQSFEIQNRECRKNREKRKSRENKE